MNSKKMRPYFLCSFFFLGFILIWCASPTFLQELSEKKKKDSGLTQRPFLEKIHLPDYPTPPSSVGVKEAFPHRFNRPVFLRSVPRRAQTPSVEYLAVVEQAGVIWVFENDPEVSRKKVFLDLQKKVHSEGNEEGLLGLAFHPRFVENGYFYVYYSHFEDSIRSSILSRFTCTSRETLLVDPASEKRIMKIPQPYSNHNGGALEFGSDAYLYIALGDGGFANDPHHFGQDLSELLGSILRIDVDRSESGRAYGIPPDNPFIGVPEACPEIWAYGLRNPWRFSFDRKTGQLWAGDVGQNLWEEIDIIVKGGNYGWKLREGAHSFSSRLFAPSSALIEPIFEYNHSQGVSITGGYVYRGTEFPELYGAYIYGDFQSRQVWALWYDGQKVIENRPIFLCPHYLASFGESAQGELYLCAFDGKIYKMVAQSPKKKKSFPEKLSQTGVFEKLKTLAPIPD
jgi:glucose/arabinose dehydrogenase